MALTRNALSSRVNFTLQGAVAAKQTPHKRLSDNFCTGGVEVKSIVREICSHRRLAKGIERLSSVAIVVNVDNVLACPDAFRIRLESSAVVADLSIGEAIVRSE